MKTSMVFLVSCFLLGFLSACNDGDVAASEEVKTAQQWRDADADVYIAKRDECRNNPGELRDTPNCINIKQAGHNTALDQRTAAKIEELERQANQ